MGPVEALLRTARRNVVDRGWCQFYTVDHGRVCLLGALASGYSSQELWKSAMRIMRAVVGNDSAAIWNDEPCRTKEHVIAAFGLAIARAKREGK